MSAGFLDLKTAKFRLLITGLPPIETSIADTTKPAQHIAVIGFCFLLGLIGGVFYAAASHMSGADWILPLVLFPTIPIAVNFLANFVGFAYLRFRSMIDKGSEELPGVRSALTFLFAISPVWVCFLAFQHWMHPEQQTGLVFYLAVPVLYVIVSETIHFVIYGYLLHDLDRDKQWQFAFATALEDPEAQHEHRSDQTTSRKVEIGSRTFTDSDIMMLEAQGNYLRIVTSSGEFIERCLMSTATQTLNEELGLQIHRSYWVSFAEISDLVRVDRNLYVQLTNGEEVKIAGPRERDVRDALAARELVPQTTN